MRELHPVSGKNLVATGIGLVVYKNRGAGRDFCFKVQLNFRLEPTGAVPEYRSQFPPDA